MYLSIGKASILLGVSVSTLRRWEREKKIASDFRTKGGHRRYCLTNLKKEMGLITSNSDTRQTLLYGRVSSYDQKDDLERQKERLVQWTEQSGLDHYEVVTDLGSGLNFRKRGLKKVISLIISGKLKRLVICHKDRLLRFGNEIIFLLCDYFGVTVDVIDEKDPSSEEEKLAYDIITIITVFSGRIYGRRSHEKKRLMKNGANATG